MSRGALLVFLAVGCGPDNESVSGQVRLGKGIDRDAYASLELRVVESEDEAHAVARPLDPDALIGISEPLDGLTFPREYVIRARYVEGDHVIGWLATERDATWVEEGEPHGSAPFALCYCATHVPAYADDVVFEIVGAD